MQNVEIKLITSEQRIEKSIPSDVVIQELITMVEENLLPTEEYEILLEWNIILNKFYIVNSEAVEEFFEEY